MNGNDNNANAAAAAAAVGGAKKRQRKRKTKKALSEVPKQPFTAVPAGSSVKANTSDQPAKHFVYTMGGDAKVVHDYIKGVFNNEELCPRVPRDAGGFELGTKVWRTEDEGVAYASAEGNAFIGVCVPNWVESSNYDGTPDPRCGCLGWNNVGDSNGAMGRAVYASSSSTVASQLPLYTDTPDGGWSGNRLVIPPDTKMDSGTRIRCTAVTLRVSQNDAKDVAAGQAMLAGTQNPLGGIKGGTLNGCTWNDVENTNNEVMTRAYRSLPQWGNDDFVIVAVPGEQQCFEMVSLPPDATVGHPEDSNPAHNKYPIFHLAMLARAMRAGGKLTYKVTFTWETETARTNSGEDTSALSLPVPQATLDIAKHYMRPYAAVSKTPNLHLLPWVQTLAHTNPGAVTALGQHPDIHPTLRPSKVTGSVVSVMKPGGFLSKLGDLGKTLLSGVAKSGALNSVPLVGPALNGLANIVSGWF